MFPSNTPADGINANGATGAAATHTLDSAAAEQALDQAILDSYLAPVGPDQEEPQEEPLPDDLPEPPIEAAPEPAHEAQPGAAPAAPAAFAVGDFAKYDKTIVEITAIHDANDATDDNEPTFDATLVTISADTGEIYPSKKKIEGKPLSSLSTIQSVATKLRLKIGLDLRAAAALEAQAADLRAHAEITKQALETYQNAKAAIQSIMPDLGSATW